MGCKSRSCSAMSLLARFDLDRACGDARVAATGQNSPPQFPLHLPWHSLHLPCLQFPAPQEGACFG